jgi:hypothetical protein
VIGDGDEALQITGMFGQLQVKPGALAGNVFLSQPEVDDAAVIELPSRD